MRLSVTFLANFYLMLISAQGVKGKNSTSKCFPSCPDGWEELEDQCYFWSTTESSWFDAEEFCNDKDGHLASITNQETHMYLRYKVNIVDGLGDIWVGGSDLEQGGVWRWADGTVWNFTRWATKPVPQPDGRRQCLAIYHQLADDGWHDWKCGHQMIIR